MKNMLKMVVPLVIFATVACVALAAVYSVTKGPISEIDARNLANAQKAIFPDADKFEPITLKSGSALVNFDPEDGPDQWTATQNGAVVGVLVRAESGGFQDNIIALVGVRNSGAIAGVKILQDLDTPGLGQNAAKDDYYVDGTQKGKPITRANKVTFYGQFANLAASDKLQVQKDGGDVIALTGATITSRTVSLIVDASAKAAVAWIAENGGTK
jgi:electron transport complex protein RnfG